MPAKDGMKKGGSRNMKGFFNYILIFALLTYGISGIFAEFDAQEMIKRAGNRIRTGIDEKGREGLLREKERIRKGESDAGVWRALNRLLDYSGIRRVLPHITVEWFVAINAAVTALVFGTAGILFGFKWGMITAALIILTEGVLLGVMRKKALRESGEDIIRFLDLLGNYNITGGELGKILGQISAYLGEPLRSALEECESTAKMTGDMSFALLQMADRIEHVQFKQIVRNLEITARYSADFSPLVYDSRKGMREYLRQREERKGMLRESFINMIVLLLMSGIVLLMVGRLIGTPVGVILFDTGVGRAALAFMTLIVLLFAIQSINTVK